MKYFLVSLAVLIVGLGVSSFAQAAPFSAENNPNIVANYSTGDHGIVGDPFLHTGADVVMKLGNSGKFMQWFEGMSAENGGIVQAVKSKWTLSKDGTCPRGSLMIQNINTNPDNFWGDYLQTGATYCISNMYK